MQIKNDPHGSARYGASAARTEMRQVRGGCRRHGVCLLRRKLGPATRQPALSVGPCLQIEARSEMVFSQILDRQFKVGAALGWGRCGGAGGSRVVAAREQCPLVHDPAAPLLLFVR